MNGADTAWILVATALVLFMALRGLALFLRFSEVKKCAQCIHALLRNCLPNEHSVVGIWLHSCIWKRWNRKLGRFRQGFPFRCDQRQSFWNSARSVVFVFQITFAIITPALIWGAYVERVNFTFVFRFSILWMLLCCAPVVHWIGGGGAIFWLLAVFLERRVSKILQVGLSCMKLPA